MRLTIQAGDVEIDLEGAAIQIDEQLLQTKTEHTWTVLLERIREAREAAQSRPWRPGRGGKFSYME